MIQYNNNLRNVKKEMNKLDEENDLYDIKQELNEKIILMILKIYFLWKKMNEILIRNYAGYILMGPQITRKEMKIPKK